MTPAREDIITLPNILTLLRIGSIPVLVFFLYLDQPVWQWAAGGLFFVAGLTDLFDGLLARRLKQVTRMGTFLDPVADKLLVASVLIMLTALGRAEAWASILIICREIAVTGMRAVAASSGFEVPSDMMGKFKTSVQMLAIWLLMLPNPVQGPDIHLWGRGALWVAVVITAWSGIGYFIRFKRGLGDALGEDLS